jgi:hypothetical protein
MPLFAMRRSGVAMCDRKHPKLRFGPLAAIFFAIASPHAAECLKPRPEQGETSSGRCYRAIQLVRNRLQDRARELREEPLFFVSNCLCEDLGILRPYGAMMPNSAM